MGRGRSGFSLIEVLVAVVIASLAGMALLEAAAQSRRAYDTALARRESGRAAALAALSLTALGGTARTDGVSVITTRYGIDNARITERLRQIRFVISTERRRRWDERNESNASRQMAASASANALERTVIATKEGNVTLYGLTGEGW